MQRDAAALHQLRDIQVCEDLDEHRVWQDTLTVCARLSSKMMGSLEAERRDGAGGRLRDMRRVTPAVSW